MNKQIPTQLQPFIEARRVVGNSVRQGVRMVLEDAKHPLTVLEINRATEQLLERKIVSSQISVVLQELKLSGVVTTRTETVEERLLRANGKPPRGYPATMYWYHGKRVPTRLVAEAIPGLTLELKPKTERKQGRPKGSKNKPKISSGLVVTSNNVTVEVSALIDEIVRLRTLELQAQISILETKLAAIKITLA
jgi:hypothetical protein